jgi:hypothetical protein
MIRIGSWCHWIAPLALATALSACGGQKEPAQKAVVDADRAISALRNDAPNLAPDDLTALDESLAVLKADLDRRDYKAVIAASPVLMTRVGALQETISTMKAEQAARAAQLTDTWTALSTEVPEMVEAVNARVKSLVRTKKYPAGMNTSSFETTRAAANEMTQTWQKALGAFANENLEEAVGSAQAAKQKGAEVMNTLGMKPNT